MTNYMISPQAVDVAPLPDYRLLVTFENHEKRVFDVKPYLEFKPFDELKNPTLFNTVKTGGISIEWIHGQDICPDELYNNSVPDPSQNFFPKNKKNCTTLSRNNVYL